MKMNDYQRLAARTINPDLLEFEQSAHALHLISAECGELHGIYQKMYQGHDADDEHIKKELGDLMWGIAELCTAYGWKLGDIAQMNIDKLKERYPNGFEAERSLHRKAGDI